MINGSKVITPAIMHSTATVGLIAASSIAGLAYAKPVTENNNIAISVGTMISKANTNFVFSPLNFRVQTIYILWP